MKEKAILNQIYEEVYDTKIPEKEKFLENYDRNEDQLSEMQCAGDGGPSSITQCAPEGGTPKRLDEANRAEYTKDWDEERFNDEMMPGFTGFCPDCGDEMYHGKCDACESMNGVECDSCGAWIHGDGEIWGPGENGEGPAYCEDCWKQQEVWKDAGLDDDSLDEMGNIVGKPDHKRSPSKTGRRSLTDLTLDEVEMYNDDETDSLDDLEDDYVDEDDWETQEMMGFDPGDEYFDVDDDWDEEDDDDLLEEHIKQRLAHRKTQLNNKLTEAVKDGTLDEKNDLYVRYQLQDWDIPNPKGTPEEYASYNYHREYQNKRIKAREKRHRQEKEERFSSFASPRHTTSSGNLLDGQNDEFLEQWMSDKKQAMTLNERIDSFLKGI